MQDFVVSFGIAGHASAPDGKARGARLQAAMRATFTLGPAWQGGQQAILLKSDQAIDSIAAQLAAHLAPGDFLIVVSISETREIRYAGWLVDGDNFDALHPDAIEVPVEGAFRTA
jgi:hypothetical protein